VYADDGAGADDEGAAALADSDRCTAIEVVVVFECVWEGG